MRRALLAITFLLAFPAAADAASVKVLDCVPSLAPADRSATFEARMRAARHSERMQVRFTLQSRVPAALRWRRVAATGFGAWLTSLPGVRRYSYAKTVVNLGAPATYRTVVRFRWLDGDGEVVKATRVTSPGCRQPDLRPDLDVRLVEVLPGRTVGERRYAVTVRNAGRSDADPFAVALRVGDAELAPLMALGLEAGGRSVVRFDGPPCTPGMPLTVTLDPGQAVDERDEDDNVLVAPCPA